MPTYSAGLIAGRSATAVISATQATVQRPRRFATSGWDALSPARYMPRSTLVATRSAAATGFSTALTAPPSFTFERSSRNWATAAPYIGHCTLHLPALYGQEP